MNTTSDKSYFLIPRVGENYERGFVKKKTKAKILVLGAYHICKGKDVVMDRTGIHETPCPYRELCRTNLGVRQMDSACPAYANSPEPEYHRLSNSNEIEICSFICGDAQYPAYSAFSHYMLDRNDHLSLIDKQRLWDSVSFTNLLQHYRLNEDDKDEQLPFEDDYQAFVEVVRELTPEVVLVWNPVVSQIIRKHDEDFSYIGQTDMPGLSVYMFTPNMAKVGQNKIRMLKYEYGVKPEKHRIEWYRSLVKKNLGSCFDVKPSKLNDTINDFAEILKDATSDGWFESSQDTLCFRDSDENDSISWKWTSTHKGYFLFKMKSIYGITKNGANAGFARIFNDAHMMKYSNDIRRIKDNDKDQLLKAIDKGMRCGTSKG